VQWVSHGIDNEAAVMRLTCDSGCDRKLCEKEVDTEIENFDVYFRTLQTDGEGLTEPEKRAIKSFCAYLQGIGPHNPRHDTDPPPTQRSEHA